MTYKATVHDKSPGVYVSTNVIGPNIKVKPGHQIFTVFVKISSGTKTDFALFESVDGSDWVAIGTPATFGSNYGIVTLKGVANMPTGTLVQVRAIGNITVDQVLVAQDQ